MFRETSRVVPPPRVLVTGVSARAAAESAARAGFAVTSVDAFADLDHHPSVRSLSLPRHFGAPVIAHAAARAARSIDCDAVVYLSNVDNHPRAVAALAEGRALWGNPPSVLERVRDPRQLTETLRRRGIAALDVFVAARSARARLTGLRQGYGGPPKRFGLTSARRRKPDTTHEAASAAEQAAPVEGCWLVKPLASGGGHRVRRWREGARVPRGCYLQQFMEGTPGSVVFVAAGGRAVPIGVSRQLVGERAFGAGGYRYCGNILAGAGDVQFERDAVLVSAACAMARAAGDAFDLVGVNGIDFIAHEGVPWPIELNPRWSASMELVERAYGLSVFRAHADACRSGALPEFDLAHARRGAGAYGKAVVFARRDVVLGDTRAWLADATVRDVPQPGEGIRAGRPICTVFAYGVDAAACHAALVRRADQVYAEVATPARS